MTSTSDPTPVDSLPRHPTPPSPASTSLPLPRRKDDSNPPRTLSPFAKMRQFSIDEDLPPSEEGARSSTDQHGTEVENLPHTDPLYSGQDPTLIELSNVLKSPKKRKALRELRDERAQLVIDFLNTLLLQPERATPRLLEPAVIALYKLARAANLYPRCHVIKDVTILPDATGFPLPREGGRTGDIYQAAHGGQLICLKVMRFFKKADLQAFLKVFAKEAIIWSQLHHPNITPFYGVFYLNEDRKRICLVSPWMTNGDIVQYLESDENAKVPRIPFIHDVAVGLEYLHRNDVVHSDLKGANILVDGSGRASICDFGMACIRHDKSVAITLTKIASGFTYRWAAPELLDAENPATRASDIWGFACVCYEVLTRKKPYDEYSNENVVKEKIKVGELPKRPPGDAASDLDTINDEMWELMNRCWAHEEAKRPGCQQILEELGLSAVSGSGIGEAHEGIRFQSAMRNQQEASIDTIAVEEILRAL